MASSLMQGNKKYLVYGGAGVGAFLLYRWYENRSSSSSSGGSTSTTCVCDDGSTPDATTGLCADGTTCGPAGSPTAGITGENATGSPTTQGSPCITSTGATGVVDFTGNCVAVSGTNPPPGKGPTKAAPKKCPIYQVLKGGKCVDKTCGKGLELDKQTGKCTKKKTTTKAATHKCAADEEYDPETKKCVKKKTGTSKPKVQNRTTMTNTQRPERAGTMTKVA